ncbi:MAG TPA: RNA polymerase sigma factor [Gemmatimonadaceae bacterium]|nr:RNA polymerase sigma factor [Gemmatimonadaceae bacterium]
MPLSLEQRLIDGELARAPRPLTDAELVAACLAGDEAAQRWLFDRHVDSLRRVAFRLCGDSDVAADITQEAFVRAFANLKQFRGDAPLEHWLVAIAASCAGKVLRKGRWLRLRSRPLHDGIALPARDEPGSDVVAHLDAALARLPHKYRVVFVMHAIDGRTHEEIAATLAIAVGTSKARLFRARARLRAALAHHGRDRQ